MTSSSDGFTRPDHPEVRNCAQDVYFGGGLPDTSWDVGEGAIEDGWGAGEVAGGLIVWLRGMLYGMLPMLWWAQEG